MSINRVVLVGNLTADPEMRSTAGGMAIMKMRLAFNDRRKNSESGQWEDVPNYVDVTMFGARAESVSRFLSKGSRIGVDGKLRWRQWETPEGDKRSAIEVIADDIALLSSRGEASSGGSGYSAPEPAANKPEIGDEIPF